MTRTAISLDRQIGPALAHEVRNPLTNINLSVEMLRAAVQDNDLKIYIDIIMRSSKKINDLINELLTTQGKVRAEKYSVHQLLHEVVESANDRIKLKNITVTKEFDPEDRRTVMDRSQLKIALSNIIINAIDAMPSGNARLDLVSKSIGSSFMLLIKDNGCGISGEDLKNIFKPYFTTKPGGLGVGLATTYDILRANHVRVNVESEVGKGTSFILLFDSEKNKRNV